MTESPGGAYSPWMEDLRARLSRGFPVRPRSTERPEGSPPLRAAAVLIPLYVREKALWTLFTKRTDLVEHHKGQISFPGGGVSDRDANLWETAIRETEEEIGVPRSSVRILGALPKLETVTDFEVSPFVGAIPYPITFAPHAGEVESIIEVPLAYLLDPMVVEERAVKWRGPGRDDARLPLPRARDLGRDRANPHGSAGRDAGRRRSGRRFAGVRDDGVAAVCLQRSGTVRPEPLRNATAAAALSRFALYTADPGEPGSFASAFSKKPTASS